MQSLLLFQSFCTQNGQSTVISTLLHSERPKLYLVLRCPKERKCASNIFTVILKSEEGLYAIIIVIFTLLHSEWPKFYEVLVVLSAKEFKVYGYNHHFH